MKIVLATRNRGKAVDMRHLLGELPIVSIPETGVDVPEIEETGETFEENAVLKARAVAGFTRLPAIGDDSGLEVDALDGAPGVLSARFAKLADDGDGDRANNARLLRLMAGVPNRRARFRSVLAFFDGETLLVGDGVCEGEILEAPRGEGGFGYDPLFYCPELGKTFAEATIEEKGRVSHRARAAAMLLPRLDAHLKR